jgi:hypothetical protein
VRHGRARPPLICSRRTGVLGDAVLIPPGVGSEAMGMAGAELWLYQRDRQMHAEVWAVEGDMALARWWATYTPLPTRFAGNSTEYCSCASPPTGRCRELIEWRHARHSGGVDPT